MRVKVTERDIQEGRRNSPYFCPIAAAIRRRTVLDVKVLTAICCVWTERKGERVRKKYKLPKTATDFILKFDRGEKVKPVTFEMRKYPEGL